MSVPADSTRDSDLILADVCLAVPALLDALAEREGEVARLRAWKGEALPVMAGLQDLGRILGLRLGIRITGGAAADAARALVARADAAEAKVRAVEGLIARVEQYAQQPWDLMSNLPTFRSEPIDPADLVMVKVSALRAALATTEPVVQHATNVPRIVAEEWANEADAVYDDEPTVQAWPQEDSPRPALNPDCAAGNKHRACAGDAWDETTDSPTTCACECHAEVSR